MLVRGEEELMHLQQLIGELVVKKVLATVAQRDLFYPPCSASGLSSCWPHGPGG